MMDGEILLYQTENGDTRIEVRLENETIWLNLNQLAELFQTTKQNVSLHLRNIFREGELSETATVKEYLTVQQEGKRAVRRNVQFYNLDVIISVGYRVNSHRGTQFRIWATNRLREFLIKGFTLDDQRLKSGGQLNYFDELLERIRDIRSAERVFYQKVKDIFATSIDFDDNTELSKAFYASMQNKLHWAVHRHTAAELIYARVNAEHPSLGLTNWAGERIRKSDVTVAKNYLSENELRTLNLLVEQYLAFAEAQALSKRPMYMRDWQEKLNDILTINEREILEGAGRISRKLADELATSEFEKFKARQQAIESGEKLKSLEAEVRGIGSARLSVGRKAKKA